MEVSTPFFYLERVFMKLKDLFDCIDNLDYRDKLLLLSYLYVSCFDTIGKGDNNDKK